MLIEVAHATSDPGRERHLSGDRLPVQRRAVRTWSFVRLVMRMDQGKSRLPGRHRCSVGSGETPRKRYEVWNQLAVYAFHGKKDTHAYQ